MIAGLSGNKAIVWVSPPLFANALNIGSPLTVGVQLPSSIRLLVLVLRVAEFEQSPPLVLLAIIVFFKCRVPQFLIPPPLMVDVLFEKVLLLTVVVERPPIPKPPPSLLAELFVKVLLLMVKEKSLISTPPPLLNAKLFKKVQLLTIVLVPPESLSPPPLLLFTLPSAFPFAMVKLSKITVPAVTSNTLTALFPLTVIFCPLPSIVKSLSIVSCSLRVMVCPAILGSKVMVSPALAFAIASRKVFCSEL